MGAFYDSVQIHSDDREAVRTLLEELAPKKKRRFLLGPALNGWIGVYPNVDAAAARDLARRLRVELLALNVHDDDIFSYEYYRDGKRVDRYNSAPDYFEEVSAKERRMLRGRPELLAHLVSDPARFQALRERLAAQMHDSIVFASELLQTFADALGIRNALVLCRRNLPTMLVPRSRSAAPKKRSVSDSTRLVNTSAWRPKRACVFSTVVMFEMPMARCPLRPSPLPRLGSKSPFLRVLSIEAVPMSTTWNTTASAIGCCSPDWADGSGISTWILVTQEPCWRYQTDRRSSGWSCPVT